MRSKITNYIKVFGLNRCLKKLEELNDENKDIWFNFCNLFNEVFETDPSVFRQIDSRPIKLYSYQNNSSLFKKTFLFLAEKHGFTPQLLKIGYRQQTISLYRYTITELPKIKANEYIFEKINKFNEQWNRTI